MKFSLLFASLLLPSLALAANWPQYRGPAASGLDTSAAVAWMRSG